MPRSKWKRGCDSETEKVDIDMIRKTKYAKIKPSCIVCFELPVPPVFEPCKNCGGNIMCLECFDHYMDTDSKCTLCKSKIRKKRHKPKEEYIFQELWDDMQKRYPSEVKARRLGITYKDEREEQIMLIEARKCLKEPEAGEIKRDFERQLRHSEEQRLLQRKIEEQQNLEYIEENSELRQLAQEEKQRSEDEKIAKMLQDKEDLIAANAKMTQELQDAELARKMQRDIEDGDHSTRPNPSSNITSSELVLSNASQTKTSREALNVNKLNRFLPFAGQSVKGKNKYFKNNALEE